MSGKLNIVKLSVGSENIAMLNQWQEARRAELDIKYSLHITRMWPKRENELLDGGSIYWVIKGAIQLRQKLIGFDEIIGTDGIRRCGFKLDPKLVPTTKALRRPFQGWRYLKLEDTPSDISANRETDDDLPEEMQQTLARLGVL